MKGSEAFALTLILSSFCLVPVSLHPPCWLRTITSQRYFLNVSSGAKRFPVGPPVAKVQGWDPRDRPCRARTQENGWLLSKAWRMQVSITAAEEDSGKNLIEMMTVGHIFIWSGILQRRWAPRAPLR